MLKSVFKICLFGVFFASFSCEKKSALKQRSASVDCTAFPDAEGCNVAVTLQSLTVTPASSTIGLEQTLKFKAVATYTDKSTKDVTSEATWSSSSTHVAKAVSASTATFKGDAAGTATITAEFEKISDSSTVTVRGASLSSLYLFPDTKPLYQGFVHRLKVFGKYSDDVVEDLTDSASWGSSDTGVATVDDTSNKGAVTLVAAGTSTITASIDGLSVSRSMTVASPTLSSVTVVPSSFYIPDGYTQNISAVGAYSNGMSFDLTDSVVWSSSATSVATVSNVASSAGKVTGVSGGSATLTATTVGVSGTSTLAVTSTVLSSVTINPASLTFSEGNNYNLIAYGVFSDSSVLDISADATWASDNAGVSVSNESDLRGQITANTASTSANVSATKSSINGSSAITVNAATLVSIAINPTTPSVTPTGVLQLSAVGTYSDASTADLTKLVTWTSADLGVALVGDSAGSKGVLAGVAEGAVTLTATYQNISGTISVTVDSAATAVVSEILVAPSSFSVEDGNTQQFKSVAIYSDFSVVNVTTTSTWSSGDTGVATVGSGTGLLTSVAPGGVSVTSTSGGKSATASGFVTTSVDGTAPTAGTFSASSSVGATGFVLNWSAATDNVSAAASLEYFVCSGAAAADIDTDAECLAETMEMNWTANTLTKTITGKSPSTTYYYNVVVRDAAANKSIYNGKTQATTTDTTAPTAGSFSASTGVSETAFTLNWSAATDNVTAAASLEYFVCSGANAAAIDTDTECLAATQEMNWTANTLTKAITGKSPSTTYYYNVVVRDAAANKSIYNGKAQATSNDTTVPTAGTFSASSGVAETAFTLNWSAASDNITAAASLEYFVCSGANAAAIDTEAECVAATQEMNWTANTLTKAITGKSPSTTYYYNVVVRDAAANKSIYDGKTQATAADATDPTAGTFSASSGVGATGFTLNWSAASDNVTAAASLEYFVCSGATAADIDTDAECLAATQEMNWTANTLTKAITGKTPGTTYYYNVVVRDAAANTSIYDGKAQATTSDSTAPTAGTFSASTSVGATGFMLNWSAASDNVTATASLEYYVCSGAAAADIDTDAECLAETMEMNWTANTLTKAITGKSPSTTYYYNVVVRDAAANTSIYNGKSQATTSDSTAPTAGTFSASSSVDATGFTLNWSAASDNVTAAASLEYFVCSGANAAAIDTDTECLAATQEMNWTANTLTKAITGKTPSTTYYYNVVVRDAASNKSIYDGKAQATTSDSTVPTAGTFSASSGVGATGFTLNWSAASDNVTAAASLEYYVCSGAAAADIDTDAECLAATQVMDWTANTLTKAVTGKAPGTTFYYNVVVRDAAANKSIYDGKTQATTSDSTAPTAGTFSASSSVAETSFTLNWSAASDNVTAAASLEYFVCSGASAAAIDTDAECLAETQVMNWTANTTTKAITGKSPGTTYYYNVVVRDAAANTTIYDGKTQATISDTTAPTAGTFSASSGVGSTGFTLNWAAASDNVTAAASLEYFVCSGAAAADIDTDTECLAATQEMNWTANTLTKAITGKSPSTTYYYNVVVRDAAANKSIYDGKTQATTADSTAPTAGTFSASTSVGATGFTLNWSAATDNVTAAASLEYFVCSGAAAADIDTDTECLAATQEMNWTANTLTKAISGKSPSTTYYYNVVVRDAAANKSIYDGKSQATTADSTVPTAGTFSASTSVGATGFTLNWSAASDNVTAAASLEYFVCSGANAAAIDTDTECLAATQEMNWTANTLTKAITGKSPSTTYYYNVVVRDAAANKAIYDGKSQATTADSTAPTAGTFSASTSVGATGFTLNWSAATDNVTAAASLEYFVCSGASAAAIDTDTECLAATQEMNWTANTLTKAITGKSPSTTYYYNVVVRDAAANRSIYDGKAQATTADTTAPTAGTFSASTSVGSSGFTLNWSAASDNITAGASLEYFVCSGANAAAIDTDAECVAATQEMNWTANTLTKAITGKSASTTYYYNVVVRDAAGNKTAYEGKSQATTGGSPTTTTSTASAIAVNNAVGTQTWANTSNAAGATNSTYATSISDFSLTTNYLQATNFASLSVPSGATINGITVTMKRQAWGDGTVTDNIVKLVKGGSIVGSNKAAGTWPTNSTSTGTYGGSSDLWGTTWSDTDFGSNFGVVISTTNAWGGDVWDGPQIDSFTITVTYTP